MEILLKDPRLLKVQQICESLNAAGHEALLAGGCVRDGILGILPNDYDVATSATPDQIEAIFAKTVAIGKAFGVILVIQDGLEIEVATFRKDGEYLDQRHPENIEFSGPEEDAKRRDFTINALFYDLKKKEVIDFVEGLKDIRAKRIVTVGAPEKRFKEDSLRILRAVRFVSQLGFNLDPETLSSVATLKNNLLKVSGERLHEELSKLLGGQNRLAAMRILFDTGLMDVILKIDKSIWHDPKDFFAKRDLNSLEQWTLWWLWSEELSSKVFSKLELESHLLAMRCSRSESTYIKKVFDIKNRFQTITAEPLGALLAQSRDPAFVFAVNFLQEKKQIFSKEKWDDYTSLKKALDIKFPEPLVQAKDLPTELRGQRIGEVLKHAYEKQLENSAFSKAQLLEMALKGSTDQ